MTNIGEIAVWFISCWGCALLFTVLGGFARKSKTPMPFWSGTKVKPEEITDIHKYNRANAKMWLFYSIPFWIAGILGIFHPMAGGILIGLSCIPGMFFLILWYRQIQKQYFVKYQK